MSPVRRPRASYRRPRFVAEMKSLSLAARLAVQAAIELSICVRLPTPAPAPAPAASMRPAPCESARSAVAGLPPSHPDVAFDATTITTAPTRMPVARSGDGRDRARAGMGLDG